MTHYNVSENLNSLPKPKLANELDFAFYLFLVT